MYSQLTENPRKLGLVSWAYINVAKACYRKVFSIKKLVGLLLGNLSVELYNTEPNWPSREVSFRLVP